MKTYKFNTNAKQMLADIITPVSIYLKLRDQFPNSILLESSDFHGGENSFSFICIQPAGTFILEKEKITENYPDGFTQEYKIENKMELVEKLNNFFKAFKMETNNSPNKVNGFFGYSSYEAVQYFETINFKKESKAEYQVPEIVYSFYKYIIAVNHFKNELFIHENLFEGEASKISHIEELLYNRNFASYKFEKVEEEQSNLTDEEFKQLVQNGKKHCFLGDVFQIVLSRQFRQKFQGDEFNVYRTLRSINPSPYLFYFDYGSYKIFGSSPEAHLVLDSKKAYINPIAGTFKRTGNDEKDKELANLLVSDKKENAEHVMLVDLARNDLSRNTTEVSVEIYREVQYYSHVIHLVSKVSGKLAPNSNIMKIMADTFPAGTLTGAPKYKAMQLIDNYENQGRSYYGGALGYIGIDGTFNHAIMIRSFLSKNNTLFYQAGAGVVSQSEEENELAEVNNKLAALKKAIEIADKL